MKIRMCGFGSLAAAAVFCCTSAFGQAGMGSSHTSEPTPESSPNAQQVQGLNSANGIGTGQASFADTDFVKKALAGSMAEVQVAQLAMQKSSNDQVKQFAQKMITDHTKLIDDMKPVAMQVGVKVPNGPDKKDKMEMAKLQGLSGGDFDKAYVQDMVKDHKMDSAAFEKEMATGQSQVVKDAARQGDPVIQRHLEMIEGIAKGMNLSAGM